MIVCHLFFPKLSSHTQHSDVKSVWPVWRQNLRRKSCCLPPFLCSLKKPWSHLFASSSCAQFRSAQGKLQLHCELANTDSLLCVFFWFRRYDITVNDPVLKTVALSLLQRCTDSLLLKTQTWTPRCFGLGSSLTAYTTFSSIICFSFFVDAILKPGTVFVDGTQTVTEDRLVLPVSEDSCGQSLGPESGTWLVKPGPNN